MKLKVQSSKNRVKGKLLKILKTAGTMESLNLRILKFIFQSFIIIFLLFTIHYSLFTTAFAAEKWLGVDEAVVKKYAKEYGREAREPFINTDQGDLLLFVFLIAGTIGGFAGGYYWRVLTETMNRKSKT